MRVVGRTRWAALVATAVVAFVAMPSPVGASVSGTPDPSAGVSGTVYAIARIGDRTIIGGDFTAVGGVARRNAAAIRADGTLDPAFKPNPNGIVSAVAVNADATRVFLGGSFTRAGGVPRAHLAAVDATTGAVIPNWYAGTNGDVDALATAGNMLYAGGKFTNIAGVARLRLAALDTTTRAVNPFFNPASNWTIHALALSPDRTKLYAAGGFTAIGGASRPGIAQLQTTTGATTAFAPTRGGVALATAVSPNGSRVFFATTDNHLIVYRPAKSNRPYYKWNTDGDIQTIAVSATETYLGGHFTHLSRGATVAARSHLASLSASGALTGWNPSADGALGAWASAIGPNRLLVGGDFLNVGGQSHPGFASFAGAP